MCLLLAMNWKILLLTVSLSFSEGRFAAVRGKWIPSFAGPYKLVVLKKISNQSNEFTSNGDFWVDLQVSHYRRGEMQYFWGRAYNRIEINDDLEVNVRMSTWSNNQWKPNAFVMKFNRACHDALLHAQPILNLAFGEDAKSCPIPPGDRIVKNETHDIVFSQFPIFPYGRWRFNLLIYRGSQVVGLLACEIETIPKL